MKGKSKGSLSAETKKKGLVQNNLTPVILRPKGRRISCILAENCRFGEILRGAQDDIRVFCNRPFFVGRERRIREPGGSAAMDEREGSNPPPIRIWKNKKALTFRSELVGSERRIRTG